MAVRTRKPVTTSESASQLALAVADVNWFSTFNLFSRIDRSDVSTLLLSCIDFRNAWQRRLPPWAWRTPLKVAGPQLWSRDLVLPSGWMKSYPKVGMRPIAKTVREWQRAHVSQSMLALVMTYPYYLHLAAMVQPWRTVYYNLDDYALYWPHCAEAVNLMERAAVLGSNLTVCVAKARADALKQSIPEAADRIRHLPHGAPEWSIGERPHERPASAPGDIAHLPRPFIGYVGSIENRVDWELMSRVAEAFPKSSVIVVGKAPDSPAIAQKWRAEWDRFTAFPNVHAIGWRSQAEIGRYYQAFDVVLVPYCIDHPFNKVCSPTKIMDVMGTGRPMVSTAVPECTLYEELFSVARSHEAFIESVGTILQNGSDDGQSTARFDWAREHTCARVARQLVDWIRD